MQIKYIQQPYQLPHLAYVKKHFELINVAYKRAKDCNEL